MSKHRAVGGLLRWTATVEKGQNQFHLCTATGQEKPKKGPVILQKYANLTFLLFSY